MTIVRVGRRVGGDALERDADAEIRDGEGVAPAGSRVERAHHLAVDGHLVVDRASDQPEVLVAQPGLTRPAGRWSCARPPRRGPSGRWWADSRPSWGAHRGPAPQSPTAATVVSVKFTTGRPWRVCDVVVAVICGGVGIEEAGHEESDEHACHHHARHEDPEFSIACLPYLYMYAAVAESRHRRNEDVPQGTSRGDGHCAGRSVAQPDPRRRGSDESGHQFSTQQAAGSF